MSAIGKYDPFPTHRERNKAGLKLVHPNQLVFRIVLTSHVRTQNCVRIPTSDLR